MTLLLALVAAGGSEVTEAHGSPWPYYVGGGILVVAMALIIGLVAFGAGRDHS